MKILNTASAQTTCMRLTLALAAGLGFAATADAARPAGSDAVGPAVLYSAPMVPGGGNDLRCLVTNVSGAPVQVTLELFGYAAYPIAKSQVLDSMPVELQSLETQMLVVTHDSSAVPMNCRFTIDASADTVRASACAASAGVNHACVEAH